MMNINNFVKGFSAFVVVVVVALLAIVGTVGFVALNKKPPVEQNLGLLAPAITPAPVLSETPVPSVSSSTDINVLQKELDDTKTNSVDSEFDSLNSSASSL